MIKYSEKKEKTWVLNVYRLLLAMIILGPLLNNYISNTTILRFIELGCWGMSLFYVKRIIGFRKGEFFNSHTKFLYIVLFCISIGIIIRGNIPTNIKDFALFLINQKGILVYIIPFIILLLPNRKYFKDIIKLFFKASLFSIPIWIINLSNLVQIGTYKGENIAAYLPFFSALLLALLDFFTKKEKLLIVSVWGVYTLLMLLNARRNVSFTMVLYAAFAYLMLIWDNWKRNAFKTCLFILAATISLLFLQLNMDNLSSGLFSNMSHRMNQETRSGVEEKFFLDFAKSPAEDWIFGRGMDGGYYQIVTNEETGETSDNRRGIETGYLHLVLKGGISYALCIVLIIFNAMYLGRKDKNKIISRYFVLIMISYLIDLYTTTPICSFAPRTIIFWFVIGVMTQRQRNESSALEALR